MLDRSAFVFLHFRHLLAEPPEGSLLRHGGGQPGIGQKALFRRTRQQGFEQRCRPPGLGGGDFQEHRIRGGGIGNRCGGAAMAQDELQGAARHEFECRQAGSGVRLACRKSGTRASADGTAQKAVAVSAGGGTSFNVAAVMMPRVPSEPTKSSSSHSRCCPFFRLFRSFRTRPSASTTSRPST